MPKKKVRKVYFGKEVQEAIIEYNSSEDHNLRNVIYRDRIHAAFDKLAENIINTFKFSYFDYSFTEVKHEVVSFLIMNIHKYDHTKGTKAFSYFSVVAKNYLILHNNNNYKKYKSHDPIDVLDSEKYINNGDKTEYYNDFINMLVEYFEENIPLFFSRKKDIDVAYAIIELMKKRENIENFNKKALYILIREMTNVKTSQITKVVNVFKKCYTRIFNEYETNGILEKPSPFKFPIT